MAIKAVSMWRSQFDSHERVRQVPGSRVKQLYTPKLMDDGTLKLLESGTEDLYASIQSHKDSCDVHVLLARYQNGDVAALSKIQGVYGDFSEMPKNYAELLNSVIAGEQMFKSLPVEIREKFDHSLEKFMIAMDDMPSFLEKIGYEPVTNSATSFGAEAEPASHDGGVSNDT